MKKKQYILAGTMLVSLSWGAQAQTQPRRHHHEPYGSRGTRI